MLIFRILGTVFLGLSCVMTLPNKVCVYKDTPHSDRNIALSTIISLLWRAFVIVALWVI